MPKCRLSLRTPTTSRQNVHAKREKINGECRIRKRVLRGCNYKHPPSDSAFTINVYGVFSGPSLLRFVRVLKTDSISAHIRLGVTSLATTNTFCFALATCENRAEAPRGLGCGSRPTPKKHLQFCPTRSDSFRNFMLAKTLCAPAVLPKNTFVCPFSQFLILFKSAQFMLVFAILCSSSQCYARLHNFMLVFTLFKTY